MFYAKLSLLSYVSKTLVTIQNVNVDGKIKSYAFNYQVQSKGQGHGWAGCNLKEASSQSKK